jgi:UDP-N-acetylglucosamine 2-epimerase (non-hydrolysing)
MKVVTILGTRPEIIRLSIITKKLDALCDHIVVCTDQNYDPLLSDIFFNELKVRKPDYYEGARGTFGEQIVIILKESEEIIRKEKPDRFLVLGDTNSSLSAIVAKRLGVPVYHMEAGNRCYDDRVPEEVNRRIIDHSSDILLPYTQNSKENLIKEGIPNNRIYVTGNPIFEVLSHNADAIGKSIICKTLKIKEKRYFLVTLHREENVDNVMRLQQFVEAFDQACALFSHPVIWSVHPRTAKLLKRNHISPKNKKVIMIEPLGLFDFIHLEKHAFCVLTDSGTVQEECCIFKIPTVTLRDTTERPETIEAGSNIISGAKVDSILRCVAIVTAKNSDWNPPREYLEKNVSDIVINILLGYNASDDSY